MTSYCILRTTGLEPDFSSIEHMRRQSFIAGACRGVLDSARFNDMGDMEGPTVCAEDYHDSSLFDWEWDAIGEGRSDLHHRLEGFLNANMLAVSAFASALAADPSAPAYAAGNVDAAWYEAGYLYVCSANGEGVGMWEYADDIGRMLSDLAAKAGEIHAAAYRNEPMVEMVWV